MSMVSKYELNDDCVHEEYKARRSGRQSALIVLALSLLPFQILIAQDNSFTFQSAVLSIALLVLSLMFDKKSYRIGKFDNLFLFGFLFIMGFGCLITVIVAPEMVVTTLLLRMGLFTVILLFFFLETTRRWSRDELLLVIRSVALSVAASTFLVFSEYIKSGNYGGRIYPLSLTGHFIDANYFALLVVLQLSFAIMMAFYERKLILRLLGFALSGFAFISIVLTGSRSGLLCAGLITILSIAAFYRDKVTKKLVTSFLLVVCLCLGFVVVSSFVSDWLFNRFFVASYDDGSNQFRVELWMRAVQRWAQRPIFGYGIGNYNYFASGDWGETVTSVTTHGTLTDFLVDFGAVGLCLFIACQLRFLRFAFRSRNYALLACVPGITICWIIIGAERSVALWLYLITFTIISDYCFRNSCTVSTLFRREELNESKYRFSDI